MRWQSLIAIYFLFWAFSAFLVLPFGVRTAEEAGIAKIPGQADSAPHAFDGKRTAIRITIVASILFGIFWANYEFGWFGAEAFDWVN